MNRKILTLTVLFLFGITLSFASDVNKETNKKKQQNRIEYKKKKTGAAEMVKAPVKIEKYKNERKGSSDKRFFKKSKRNIINKFKNNILLNIMRVNALIIIGFLIFLPGLVLTLIGIALIPALVLVLVGGTLWIIGLIKMKNSV